MACTRGKMCLVYALIRCKVLMWPNAPDAHAHVSDETPHWTHRTPPDSCPGYNAAITSRRPYDIFIGYPCDSEYCSKLLSLFTNVWMARHRRTWRMIVSWSPISGRVDSVRLILDFAPSNVAVPPTATGVLLPPAHKCGTPCQPN